jgi:quercetin dioxygenase-like cupin family protein
MKVVKISDVQAEDRSGASLFIGKVTGQPITDDKPGEAKGGLRAVVVNFSPGARTKFHIHDHPQILCVTKGRGIVATEKEEVVVTPGMVIMFPAGENHWHGATEDSEFSHISITTPGKTTW